MQKIKSKKGISLIVLVITIIVMIILAAAIILSLNNAGIIGNANKAVEMTNDAQVQTAADLAYAEYLIDNSVVGEGNTLETWLNEKVDYEGYNIHVVDDEPIVVKEGSLADKFYNEEIKIGDYVNYKATETTKTVDVNVIRKISNDQPSVDAIVEMEVSSEMKWRVLGVDKTTKELLIVSEGIIDSVTDKETSETAAVTISGLYGWVHGEEILDNACAEFGNGTYATKARSVNLEDVETITKYDKTKFAFDTGIKYGETVYYDGKEHEGKTFPIVYHPVKDEKGNYKFDENRVPIMEKVEKTIVNGLYFYKLNEVLDEESVEYKLLAVDSEEKVGYYLNEKVIGSADADSVYYSYFAIGKNGENIVLGHAPTFRGRAGVYEASKGEGLGIRPVVHLNSNLTATFENNEWILK